MGVDGVRGALMNGWMIFLTVFPLVIYVVVDSYAGLKTGIWSAVAVSALVTAGFFILIGGIEWEGLFVFLLMVGSAYLSVTKEDPIYFKLQPMLTGIGSASVMAYYQFFDQPLIVKFLPQMKKMVTNLEHRALLDDPNVLKVMISLNLYLIVFSFLHALLMAFAALKWSNTWWIVMKAAGVPFVVGCSFLTHILLG